MKLNNIFLTLTMIAGMMFSCVSEDIVGPYSGGGKDVIDGLPTTLSIKLSPGKIATKAIGETPTPYEYATYDELFVGEAAVAIFDVDENNNPTTLRAYEYVMNPVKTATTTDTLAWEISGIDATTGKAHILVIANLPASKLSKLVEGIETTDPITYPSIVGTSYSEFKALIATESFDATFDPTTLVKVGELLTTLSTDNKVIEIPMVQLAAKVNLTINIAFPEDTLDNIVEYPNATNEILKLLNKDLGSFSHKKYPNINNDKEVFPVTYNGIEYYAFNCEIPGHVPSTAHYINPFWGEITHPSMNYIETAYGVDGANMKVVEVAPRDKSKPSELGIDSVSQINRWAFYIETTTVNNIQTKTDVLIQDRNSQPLVKRDWIDQYRDTVFNSYNISFYTYETLATNEDLTIDIDGQLICGIQRVTKHYNASLHGLWVYGKNSSTPGKSHTGWGGADDVFAALMIEGELAGIDDKFVVNEQLVVPKKYTLKVNTTDILHGTLYDLKVTMGNGYLPTKAATDSDISNFGILINRSNMPW